MNYISTLTIEGPVLHFTVLSRPLSHPLQHHSEPLMGAVPGPPSQHKPITTFSSGYLGSRNDEERSEMRYVMRIAELSESSKF